MPSKISAYIVDLLKYFHAFTDLVLPSVQLIQTVCKPSSEKTQRINCWRNLSPITTVIRQSASKTSLANQRTRVHTNHSFCTAYFPFLLREALALFSSPQPSLSCKWAVWTLLCRCLNTAAFQASGNIYVIVNVIRLYLPCRVILPQNTFGWTVQKLREAFECWMLKWH